MFADIEKYCPPARYWSVERRQLKGREYTARWRARQRQKTADQNPRRLTPQPRQPDSGQRRTRTSGRRRAA